MKCYVSPEHNDGAIPLLKLHGSINFFELPMEPGRLQLRFSVDVAPKGHQIGGSGCPDGPVICAVDGIWALRAKYGSGLVPALVPPTYAKLRGYGWLQVIWAHALQAVWQAKKLIFVGYSLPESDGFMKAMLQAGMALRQGTKPSVLVIDPCEATLGRYEQFFRPLGAWHIECKKMSFEDAVENGVFAEAAREFETAS